MIWSSRTGALFCAQKRRHQYGTALGKGRDHFSLQDLHRIDIISQEIHFLTVLSMAACNFTGACYCMGLLSADASADLLDPNSWKKTRYPVLQSDKKKVIYGPGHNSFFTDDKGNTIMAYHARPYDEITGDPLYDPNRHCYLMNIQWENDVPVFSYSNQPEL